MRVVGFSYRTTGLQPLPIVEAPLAVLSYVVIDRFDQIKALTKILKYSLIMKMNYQKAKVIEKAGLIYDKSAEQLKEEKWFEQVKNPPTEYST